MTAGYNHVVPFRTASASTAGSLMNATFEPQARINPHLETSTKKSEDLYRVTIIDNDINTYDQVIQVCMEALQIKFEDAYRIALAVDNNGHATVFEGKIEEAQSVASVIRTIGIEVRVEQL